MPFILYPRLSRAHFTLQCSTTAPKTLFISPDYPWPSITLPSHRPSITSEWFKTQFIHSFISLICSITAGTLQVALVPSAPGAAPRPVGAASRWGGGEAPAGYPRLPLLHVHRRERSTHLKRAAGVQRARAHLLSARVTALPSLQARVWRVHSESFLRDTRVQVSCGMWEYRVGEMMVSCLYRGCSFVFRSIPLMYSSSSLSLLFFTLSLSPTALYSLFFTPLSLLSLPPSPSLPLPSLLPLSPTALSLYFLSLFFPVLFLHGVETAK